MLPAYHTFPVLSVAYRAHFLCARYATFPLSPPVKGGRKEEALRQQRNAHGLQSLRQPPRLGVGMGGKRPRTARISCGSGAGRSLLFVDVQPHTVLNQGDCLVHGLIPGEVGAQGLQHDVGQGIVRPVDLGGVVN